MQEEEIFMITIKDIAKKAGVSSPTVSLVLNGKAKQARISKIASERIFKISLDLGYTRNELARAVKRGRSNMVAMIYNDFFDADYISKTVSGILAETNLNDYGLKVFNTKDLSQTIRKILEFRIKHVIMRCSDKDAEEKVWHECKKYNINLVGIEGTPNNDFISIISDDHQGASQAMEYFFTCGHRRIALLNSFKKEDKQCLRYLGYFDSLKKQKIEIDEDLIFFNEDLSGHIDFLKNLMKMPKSKRPTAIFCASDIIAFHVQRFLYRNGFSCPEDLSIIGFADLFLSDLAVVPLTTIQQPFEQMGGEAFRALINFDSTKENGEKRILLPTKLIIRESVAKI